MRTVPILPAGNVQQDCFCMSQFSFAQQRRVVTDAMVSEFQKSTILTNTHIEVTTRTADEFGTGLT
jgi:hypothetical protein